MKDRIGRLLAVMSLEEKVALMSGTDMNHTAAIDRLKVPAMRFTDGPHGARMLDSVDTNRTMPATCFPAAVGLAATWDPGLIEKVGQFLGEETRARGCHVLLGPCVNIHRVPLGGRSFESYSEDPYLSTRMAVAWIRGLQSQGVGASVKHFALNNQEYERMTISSEMDERTMREIYFPSFEAAVKEADTWTVMSSYNRINGTYAADHHWLLTGVLRDEWGFTGLVMSDWFSMHSTVEAATSGLDLEMPGPALWFGEKLAAAVRNGEVGEATIDIHARRVLELLERTGGLDTPLKEEVDLTETAAHNELAREVAEAGIVLLKNEGDALPLVADEMTSVAVIGPNAATASIQGGGSSQVMPYYAVSPLEGLKKYLPESVSISYEPGCSNALSTVILNAADVTPVDGNGQGLTGQYYQNNDLSGESAMTKTDSGFNFHWFRLTGPFKDETGIEYSVRWRGGLTARVTGRHTFGLKTNGWATLSLDGKEIVSTEGKEITGNVFRQPETTGTYEMAAGKTYWLEVTYRRNPNAMVMLRAIRIGMTPPVPEGAIDRAVRAAGQAEATIIFAGLTNEYESEGFDRETMDLPAAQVELIRKVAAANKRTIVVLNNGAPITLEPWQHDVASLVEAWYPGQECGNAIARVLLGEVNPSGKLPDTFPKRYEDNPAYGNYPGSDDKVTYAERLLVGYRHYDTNGVAPSFPFGHGLSYTEFRYGDLSVDKTEFKAGDTVMVSLAVTNTGRRAGAETVQVYVRDKASQLPRPDKELKAFKKVHLEPGETENVTLTLDKRSFSYYDPDVHRWTAEPGDFELLVGSSSRDIRASLTVTLV